MPVGDFGGPGKILMLKWLIKHFFVKFSANKIFLHSPFFVYFRMLILVASTTPM